MLANERLEPPARAHADVPWNDGRVRLAFLGTAGGPDLVRGRAGIASALVVNGHVYLVDAGRAAASQYANAGLPIDRLRAVLITHLHGDHVSDLFTLFMYGGGHIRAPVDVLGPGRGKGLSFPVERPYGVVSNSGLRDLIERSYDAFATTLNAWSPVQRRSPGGDLRDLIAVTEIERPTLLERTGDDRSATPPNEPLTVYENADVRVTAVAVPHLEYSLAFRFDTDRGSVAFSGDSGPSDSLIALARGADVLVHEVVDTDTMDMDSLPDPIRRGFQRGHTSLAEVGNIAQKAGVRMLVLNHFIPADPELVNAARWQQGAQNGYGGRVIVAEDLTYIEVGSDTDSPEVRQKPVP